MAQNLTPDLWWKILSFVCEGKFDFHAYSHDEYPLTVTTTRNAKTVGKHITADLFLLRRVCKSCNAMVKKYSRLWYSKRRRELLLQFKFS